MNIRKLLYLLAGFFSLGLGCIGIVLPIIPTVPFFLVTVYSFARSSKRLHDWFTGTKLYKKHLESFVQKRGMTVSTKVKIMGTVTLIMFIGFVMMGQAPVGRMILAVVWVFHVLYFIFRIKTIKE